MRTELCCVVLLTFLPACAKQTAPNTVVMSAVNIGMDEFDVRGAEGAFTPNPDAPELLELGRWYLVGEQVAFSYIDPVYGSSMSHRTPDPDGPDALVWRVSWAPADARVLEPSEVRKRGLPETPDWLQNYDSQPAPGTIHGTWRSDPMFAGRLHENFPDDMRVIVADVEDGEVANFEIIWVRVLSCDGPACRAALFNQPASLPMQAGDPVDFDLDGVAPERLPAAVARGAPLPPALMEFAASSPDTAGLLQDATIWLPAESVPRAERLPPVGRWIVAGDEVAYTVLGHRGVEAVVVNRAQGASFEVLRWQPPQMRFLSDDERIELGLPEALSVDGYPPQPEPGPWGAWRVDPGIEWVFWRPEAEPDAARVVLGGLSDLALATVIVRGCDHVHCWGPLLEGAGGYPAGRKMRFAYRRLDGTDFPRAWPFEDAGPSLP